ncbi:hypothetical protein ZEAMMB73_Zm00001d036828 [Zea mays]|uniref:Uncharacterized protein n=1 Tax=Zea mays TaxID=4577 RepID=A0A1D6LRY8_MAIZE|nr:hypothetical protein ZEAMMB73_Zm00001d036828 [Zea mays]
MSKRLIEEAEQYFQDFSVEWEKVPDTELAIRQGAAVGVGALATIPLQLPLKIDY